MENQNINQNIAIINQEQDNMQSTIVCKQLKLFWIQIQVIHLASQIYIQKDENINYGLQTNQMHI